MRIFAFSLLKVSVSFERDDPRNKPKDGICFVLITAVIFARLIKANISLNRSISPMNYKYNQLDLNHKFNLDYNLDI